MMLCQREFRSARGIRLGGFVIHSNLSNVGHLLAALRWDQTALG
jgi:hypothetical protein